jgi:hypothetical protein
MNGLFNLNRPVVTLYQVEIVDLNIRREMPLAESTDYLAKRRAQIKEVRDWRIANRIGQPRHKTRAAAEYDLGVYSRTFPSIPFRIIEVSPL